MEGHATRLGTKKPAEKGRAMLNALDRSGAGLRGRGSPRVQRGLFLCGPPPCALGAEQRGCVFPPSLLPWPRSWGADTRRRCEECGHALWEQRTWPVDLGLREARESARGLTGAPTASTEQMAAWGFKSHRPPHHSCSQKALGNISYKSIF